MKQLLVIGDSNLRNSIDNRIRNDPLIKEFSENIFYIAVGGTGTYDLRFVVQDANRFDVVLTVLGNNDLSRLSDEQIIHNFEQFFNNIDKKTSKFLLGFLPRRDHQNSFVDGVIVNPVTQINLKLYEKFPNFYVSPRDFKREDFGIDMPGYDDPWDPAHLNELGIKHMARFLKSFCEKHL